MKKNKLFYLLIVLISFFVIFNFLFPFFLFKLFLFNKVNSYFQESGSELVIKAKNLSPYLFSGVSFSDIEIVDTKKNNLTVFGLDKINIRIVLYKIFFDNF